jgi:hypothetical protein
MKKSSSHPMPGLKHDQGKPCWNFLPWEEVREIVKVLTYGAQKYPPNNWQRVKDPRARYFSALMRHLTAWWGGEEPDFESGLSHLAHAGCCLLFLMWHTKKLKGAKK